MHAKALEAEVERLSAAKGPGEGGPWRELSPGEAAEGDAAQLQLHQAAVHMLRKRQNVRRAHAAIRFSARRRVPSGYVAGYASGRNVVVLHSQ